MVRRYLESGSNFREVMPNSSITASRVPSSPEKTSILVPFQTATTSAFNDNAISGAIVESWLNFDVTIHRADWPRSNSTEIN